VRDFFFLGGSSGSVSARVNAYFYGSVNFSYYVYIEQNWVQVVTLAQKFGGDLFSKILRRLGTKTLNCERTSTTQCIAEAEAWRRDAGSTPVGPEAKSKWREQGRRHNFKSGGTMRAKRGEKCGVCTSTYDILEVQQLQRDIRRAYRTALAQVDNSRWQISMEIQIFRGGILPAICLE